MVLEEIFIACMQTRVPATGHHTGSGFRPEEACTS